MIGKLLELYEDYFSPQEVAVLSYQLNNWEKDQHVPKEFLEAVTLLRDFFQICRDHGYGLHGSG